MKKSLLCKILIFLGCVIMVALPVLFINSTPAVEVHAYSVTYNTLTNMQTLAEMDTYVEAADTATLDILTEYEVKCLVNKAYDLLYPTEDSTPADADKLLYVRIANNLLNYYQQTTEYLYTEHHAPTASNEVKDYYIGGSSQFKGISDGGFTISQGTVNLHVTSPAFFFHGPIVMDGGTLNVFIETNRTDSTHLKREIEDVLRIETEDGISTSGYIPADASKDLSVTVDSENKVSFVVTQYSGELFKINKGTVDIRGNSTTPLTISGAGNFTFDAALLRDSDSENDNNGDIVTFPIPHSQNPTADDVEAKGPLIYVSDTGGNSNVSISYAKLLYNNNGVNTQWQSGPPSIAAFPGSRTGGAICVSGESPRLSLSNVEVGSCRTRNQGGFMQLSTTVGGDVTLTDVKISGCYTEGMNNTEGGTLRTLGSSCASLSMIRVEFDHNYSKYSASAFIWSALPAGELLVDSCNIHDNTSYRNSTIVCMGRMNIQGDTKIQNNCTTRGGGGAISFSTWSSATSNKNFRLENDANLVLGEGVLISGNSAGGNGGAIELIASLIRTNTNDPANTITYPKKYNGDDYSMSLTINGATIRDNTAKGSGGAIYIYKASDCPDYIVKANVNGGAISGNSANNGGAFWLTGLDVDFTITGGTVSENTATSSGGAVYMKDNNGAVGKVNISGGNIHGNTAGLDGGGIYILKGSLEFSNGTLQNNSAGRDGGGAYIESGNVKFAGGSVLNNKAINQNSSARGGGIFVKKGNLTVDSGTFSGNQAYKEGGALCVNGAGTVATLNGGTITENNATGGHGGGVYIYLGSLTVNGGTLTGNTAAVQGGAAYINGGLLKIQGVSNISGNSAPNGGAVGITSNATSGGSFHMENGVIDGNNATTGKAGAVYIIGNNSTFTIDDGTISNNTSKTSGGAVFLNGGADFTMNNGRLYKNTAGTFAGCVDIQGGGSFIMYDGTIEGNKTLQDSGGAVRVEGGGSFTMWAGTIKDNVSAASAGALRMVNGNFTMHGGVITNNGCRDSGGFMYMQGGTCTIYNGTISNNYKTDSESNRGGAILLGDIDGTPGKFIMYNGDIFGNTSAKEAGAIFIYGKSTFEMQGGSIRNNRTATNGGAIFIEDGTFSMSGGSINNNIAGLDGGAVYIQKGDFNMTGGEMSLNISENGNGGAVYIKSGDFEMSSGTLTNNKASNGNGGAVYTSGTVIIGAQGCNGDANLDTHTLCPVITDNFANNGGAFAIDGGSPTIHCGSILNNSAILEGGAMYVTNGNVLVNYVIMENNMADSGGGFSIIAASKNLSVTISSGFIRYNKADYGGGMKIHATGSYVTTVVVGIEACKDDPESTHKHPDISGNIAQTAGGGLHLVSDSANGIVFTMWCGMLHQNIANSNIPTGNIIQEGGRVSIHGAYSIDNVTVNNGTYERPSYSDDQSSTVTINFNYRFPEGFEDDDVELKSIILTLGEAGNDGMYINLPAYQNIKLSDGTTMILLRWSESNVNNETTYDTASKLVINKDNFTPGETVTLFGVWIAQGAGIAENPYVVNGQRFETWQDGMSIANIAIDGFFTAMFEVSECDPSKFSDRYLTLGDALNSGTVIIMIDLTARQGYNEYYYYVLDGVETSVSLSDFTKLGSPNVNWSNSRSDANGEFEEDFLFMFDLGATEESFMGTFWLSLTREYLDENKAPLSQTVSCAINETVLPSITVSDESGMVEDSLTVTYQPGSAEYESSVYYNSQASLVISAKDAVLPTDAYILVDSLKYEVNTSGVIIIPLGDANTSSSITMKLISSSLTNSEMGITLNIGLYMCPYGECPLNDKRIYSAEIEMIPIPLPAVSISMDKRIFYLSDLPDSVILNVEKQNISDQRLEWTVEKQPFLPKNSPYSETNEVTIIDGVITFNDNITEGNFRIILTVKDAYDTILLTVPYNFIVLES